MYNVGTKEREVNEMTPTYYMQTIKPNGNALTPVIKQTEEAQSKYANKMFQKYGDEVTVVLYHFDDNCNCIEDCIWHA